MANPVQPIIGGFEPPEPPAPKGKTQEDITKEEQNYASIARDTKWGSLVQWFDERIFYYEEALANGLANGAKNEDVGEAYKVCKAIGNELRACVRKVEMTAAGVKDAEERAKRDSAA